MTLSGFNFYTGGTTITGGTLRVATITDGGVAGALGNSTSHSSNLVLGGGTLEYTGSLNGTTDRNFSLINGTTSSICVTNSTVALTLSGVADMTSGSLIKVGAGTLVLLGNNTYTGSTIINGGTLQVGNGGTSGALGTGNWINNSNLAFNRSDDLRLDKAISGTGSLTKLGTNMLTLGGNNTHSGGTIVNAGILSVAKFNALGTGDLTLNNGNLRLYSAQEMAGNVQIGGNFVWNNGAISYFDTGESPGAQDLKALVAGNFTNGGAGGTFEFSKVEALDAGVYTLVSFNGTTNFTQDQFQALAGPGTTLHGTFEVLSKSIIYNLTGATSGGGIHIENNGGPNTPVVADYFTDGQAMYTVDPENKVRTLRFQSNGTLDIEDGGKLLLTKGDITVNDGSSEVRGGLLVAMGNLTKKGEGELDISTDVIVAGTTNVNEGLISINGRMIAGEVVVNPLGTLGGAGLIVGNVRSAGVVSPGNSPGTLAILGNSVLESSNSLNIEIASTSNFDRIVVSGQMTVAGTLNAIPYGGMNLAYGQRYAIIEAGSISGAFDSIVVPNNLRGRFLNLGTIGLLVFAPDSFDKLEDLTENQKNVAEALNDFLKSSEKDKQAVCTALDLQTIDQYPASFDQISMGFYESLVNIVIEQSFNQTQLLNQRISSVRLGAVGFQAIGGITQPLMHDKDGKSAAAAKTGSPIVESATETNWNAWALGTGMFSRTTNLGNLQNYNNDAGGFLVGSDYRWSKHFVTGLYAGYDYSYAEYSGGGSAKGNSFNFGTYASYAKDGYYADAIVGGGYTGFQTKRSIQFSTIDRTALADPNSAQFTAGLNLGKDFQIRKFTFGPIAGAQFTAVNIGSFTETGAESLDLALAQENANSLRSTLGGRVAYTWNLNKKITLIPELRMFWQHEFLNDPRTMSASLDGGNGASFDYQTTDPYRDSVFAGVGATAQFGENLSGSIFYNINFGSLTYQNNTISAGLNLSF